MKKRLLTMALALTMISIFMVGCAKNEKSEMDDSTAKKSIKIGTFATSAMAAESGKESFEKMGYEIEIVVFDDAVLPNTALAEGSIDINLFQHTPYLEAYLKENDAISLSMVDPLIYYPNYGLYSSKYDSIDEIPENGIIGIYNDASNIDRGLRLLDACGLIGLTDEERDLYNTFDIVENPKNLTFIEMAFGTTVRALGDTDASISVSSHLLQNDMDPSSALVFEEVNKDFSCGLTVRSEDLDSDWLKDLVKAYTSDDARESFNESYKGASSPLY